MLNERFDRSQRFSQREDRRGASDLQGSGFASGEDEGDHSAVPSHLAACDAVAGVLWQTRIVDGSDRGMSGEELGYDSRVRAMALHAQGQRLDPAQHEVAVKRPGDAAGCVLEKSDPCRQLPVVGCYQAANDITVAAQVLRR